MNEHHLPHQGATDGPAGLEGGRGDATRARLLKAGLELFGAKGFDAVTTRELAARAEANQAAIPYHFGGKRELYRAVAEYAFDSVGHLVLPLLKKAEAGLRDPGLSRPGLALLVGETVSRFARIMLGDSLSSARAAFVIRQFSERGEIFDMLFDRAVGPVQRMLTLMAAKALDVDPDGERAKIAALALAGQIMGFGTARAVVLRRMEWPDLDGERLDKVVDVVRSLILAGLGLAPAGTREG